jgi:hypothetical protein
MRTVLSALVTSCAGVAIATAAATPDLSWLSGYWLSCTNNREVTENWSDARGGIWIGLGITVAQQRSTWEFMRIQQVDGSWVLHSEPRGQAPTDFTAIELSATRALFENLQHDYPQRVIYQREGAKLHARIEGSVAGKPRSSDWLYDAAPLNKRCP